MLVLRAALTGVPGLLCKSLPELCEAITRVACSSCPGTGHIVWDEQSRGFRGERFPVYTLLESFEPLDKF